MLFRSLILCGILLLFSCASSKLALSPETLPANCQTGCVTPFGQVLGTTKDQVVAYSNCQASCIFENPSKVNGVYAGIQWQCVEFARRWLIQNKGITFASIDWAADLWSKENSFQKTDGGSVKVSTFTNGSKSEPKPGDLLIYSKEFLGTGHIAVVLEVNTLRGMVRVGEENFSNEPWVHNYAREIPYILRGKDFWILDPFLLGWKSF